MSLLPSSSRGIWTRAIEDQNFAAILDWFSIYFFGCGIAVLLSIDAVALLGSKTPFESTMRAASGGLMLAATALIAGWLLGLLFGIPRSLSRSQPASGQQAAGSNAPAPGGSSSRPSRTNTNLEDVSDWLSKTVVGLGLASLYQIPGYTWKKSGQIGAQIFPAITGGQGFAFLVVAYFTGGGFWIGYIGTRTLITLLFDGIDRDAYTKVVAESGDPRNLTTDPTTGAIKAATDGLQQADAQLLARPVFAMNTPTELAAWAAATARSGDWSKALTLLGEAAKSAPSDPTIKDLLSIVSKATKSGLQQ